MNKIAKTIMECLFYMAVSFLSITIAELIGFKDSTFASIFSGSLYIVVICFYLKGRDVTYNVKIKEKI